MELNKRKRNYLLSQRRKGVYLWNCCTFAIPVVALTTLLALSQPWLRPSPVSSSLNAITVISTEGADSVARKQRLVLEESLPTANFRLQPIILNREEQRSYVKANDCGIEKFDALV